jgi:hypothetical protein
MVDKHRSQEFQISEGSIVAVKLIGFSWLYTSFDGKFQLIWRQFIILAYFSS